MSVELKAKNLCMVLWVGLGSLFLSSCVRSEATRAALELKRMDVSDFFEKTLDRGFVDAVQRGHFDSANKFLSEGANVDARGVEGMTPLSWCLAKQDLGGFRFLLRRGANPNIIMQWSDEGGRAHTNSVLHMATILKDSTYLSALLSAGGDPDLVMDSTSQTPIFVAIHHRRRENIELLLDSGADVDHRDASSVTPIHFAVEGRHYDLAMQLLRSNADPTIKDRWGYSAVDTTKQFGNRGVVVGSKDDEAYPKFVAELKSRGVW